MIFKNPLKTGFLIRNILIKICFRRVWIVMRYLLFDKYAFNGFLKVSGAQRIISRLNSELINILY